jgi:uncharacterized protein (TIGR00369 family)
MEKPDSSKHIPRKINNPFKGSEGYHCFGCDPDNHHGLKMEFVDEGEWLTARWKPRDFFQGYKNVLHGGIQSTLMDEIASWYVYTKLKTAGVTSKMEIRYKKPVYVNRGEVFLRAKLIAMQRNLADFHVELLDSEKKLCAEGMVQYFTFSQKIAQERFWYPGVGAFYED